MPAPKSPKSKYTAEQKAEALLRITAVGPSEAARELKLPRGTVCRWAKEAGIESDHSEKTREAVEAASARRAATRSRIADKLLAFVENSTGDIGSCVPVVTARDKQNMLVAIGIALQRSLELERFDSDDRADKTALSEWLRTVRGA